MLRRSGNPDAGDGGEAETVPCLIDQKRRRRSLDVASHFRDVMTVAGARPVQTRQDSAELKPQGCLRTHLPTTREIQPVKA